LIEFALQELGLGFCLKPVVLGQDTYGDQIISLLVEELGAAPRHDRKAIERREH